MEPFELVLNTQAQPVLVTTGDKPDLDQFNLAALGQISWSVISKNVPVRNVV